MDGKAAERWNRNYSELDGSSLPQPCYALEQFSALLPSVGNTETETPTALDLACGLGGNALYLSQLGYVTHAWDISTVAIDHLHSLKQEQGVSIACQVRDVVENPPLAQSMDIIVVSRFLHRALADTLVAALRDGGLLYYQTFAESGRCGPSNPDYLLSENELLSMFSSLTVRAFIDTAGRARDDFCLAHESMLVGQKCQSRTQS